MDIDEEIKFPFKDSDWLIKVLIGGFLGMIPIINFFVGGYYIKVLKKAIEGTPEMPKWDDWGRLFITGLFVFIIKLIYYIIPLIVAATSLGGIIFSAIFDEVSLEVIGAALGGILLSIILLLIVGFLIPMALAMYIKNESIGAAFRVGELLLRIRSVFGDYLTVYILILVLFIILSLAASIPILGPWIFIFGKFYILVVAANMYGKVYAKSKPSRF